MSAPNGNGIPAWLADLGLKNGDYYVDSKLRAKRAMKSACFSPPARIHICLGLATMGFQQELAVRLEGNKRVPIQPADVCQMTGLDKRHFREYMNSLEAMGLAAIEGWTKSRVKLYSWAIPREVDPKKMVPRAGTIFPGIPPALIPLLKHYRVRLPADFVPRAGTIPELERLARATKEAETSLRAYVKGLCAGDTIQRNGKEPLERNGEAPPPVPPPPVPALPSAVSSSSISKDAKKTPPAPSLRDDDEKPKPEYATPKDELKAIYFAKTGEYPAVSVLDRVEGILATKGKTWGNYLEILKPHLGGKWERPAGFLTWLARTGFEAESSPPQLKPKPKCPTCFADNQRGAILLNGAIVPCPACSTAEWRKEMEAKLTRPALKTRGAAND